MKFYRLVLLDVDGTLVHCAGAGRRSLERALHEAFGHPDGDLSALRLDGSTDRLIVREAMALLGKAFTDEACDLALSRYPKYLAEELADPGFKVLPGVVMTLTTLRARKIAYGLCTGNVMEGARLKLRRGALDGYFEWGKEAVGGFADDGEDRTRLVLAALERASARHGTIAPEEVLVVGDTPFDVAAAHGAGCAALGVATGRYSVLELRSGGADHVVESLSAPSALGILFSEAPSP
ncbi:MAG TPA: HAD family hydrolase [Anaeromyxobacter sp.]|nr:HAD family hydrolase [Anaeromyxobacter sp.]